MIAGMRDTDEPILEAERAHDLRRAGKQRGDAPDGAHRPPKRSSPPTKIARRRAGKFLTSSNERSSRFSTRPEIAKPGVLPRGTTTSSSAAPSTRTYDGSATRGDEGLEKSRS